MIALTDTMWGTQISQVFVPPRVQTVSSTVANGTYLNGAVIPITVTFNHEVNVVGVPQLALNSGGTAVYTSGSGSNTLTFTYTVGNGQSSADLDYISANAITLPGGATIRDATSALDAELTLADPGTPGSLGFNKAIVVNGAVAGVSGVSSTTVNGEYGPGANISITVTFNRAVVVTGTPQLALNSGGIATYASGSGSTTLTFNYTVAAGQSSPNLDYTSASALSLSGGTIKDQANSSDAVLTLPAPGAPGSLGANKNIVIDAVSTAVFVVTSPTANGTYGIGAVISVAVTFDEDVVVTGTPQIALNSGGIATYASGSGTATLTFTYTVAAGQNSADLDYTSTTALTLNGGTIVEETGGLSANLTLPAPGAAGSLGANKNIVIDTVEASVTTVSSPNANATYAFGSVIDITVQFSQPVTVTGTPQLALDTGASAAYISGSGTATLTFRYTVGSGENAADLDYASATALSGGTIKDADDQDANLTLPAPGSPGSLGANKNIVVDTVAPTVLQFRVLFGSKWYNVIGSSRFTLPWQVKGIQVVFSERVMTGNVLSLNGLTATRLTGLKTNTLTWHFPAKAKGTFSASLANSGANALKDASGNPIPSFSQAFNVLYGDFTGDGVVNAADETGVRASLTPPYQLNAANYNIFADLSGDGIVNLIDVGITRTRKGQAL